MSKERFKPPSARVEDPDRGKGSTVKGVVAGLVVDLLGTMLFGVVASIGAGALDAPIASPSTAESAARIAPA